VAQDGLGQLHLRGEHANLQYRINDVLLPEGITGFGQELDARFLEDLHLVTGSLPAQYGFRTAGIVDLHTKSGAFENGGEASLYGGSFETIKPSFEYGGSQGNLNYFADGSYNHNNIGIESPTSSHDPIHDITDQFKTFAYLSYVLDDTSRISLMGSASYADFELPNTPGLVPDPAPGGTNWFTQLPVTNFNSARLNERQNEQNYYGIVAYQKSVGDLNLQIAGFARNSSVHFRPDPLGDLFFDGVASDVNRKIYSAGVETDLSYALNDKHTVRGGFMVLDEVASIHTSTSVFPTDADGNPTGSPFSIPDNSTLHGLFAGAYVQDEWKILPKVTINFGARFDLVDSFVDENQASPRVNLIYQPTESTALHAGYARYFTPPALENVNATTVTKFEGTSNASEVEQATPARSERADYFDAGITHKLFPGLQLGVDGYYKKAKNQLDDGLFGQSLILSQFNYREGEVYGVEFTANYTHAGFSAYANIGVSRARGKDVVSGQFLFGQDDLDYIHTHWVNLDHDQLVSGSFGASYLFKHDCGNTRLYVDALYGSGLRTDATAPDGSTIPNGGSVPAYYSVSLGVEHAFKMQGKERFKARLDVVNITDKIYELRDGGGIGVNAAQFGMRLGFFGGVSYVF
jgi:outer membrane receptor protein involved in Fe transport